MCGIAGYIGNKSLKKNNISNLLKLMKNRGPNSQKYLRKKISSKFFFNFFFSRLSIIDMNKRSNQPFKYKNLTLIFNGEIYNYKELKIILKKKNYIFYTNSDTEVLIKSIHCWGNKAFTKLEGMWSLVYYDESKNKTFFCRDRFGEKPFHYLIKNNEIYFGSEIRFIKEIINFKLSINYELIRKFISFGYKILFHSNETFFNEIKRLEPATYIEINHKNNKIIQKKYWDISKVKVKKLTNDNEIINKVKKSIINSLKMRLRSDVPIAFCLSGGVDSNILASFSKKILNYKVKTFSVLSKDKFYNENKNIFKSLSNLKVDHNFINFDQGKINFLKLLTRMINTYDQPVITLTSMLHWKLMEKIKQKNYKVCISGIGGDELFTGYYHHYVLMIKYLKNLKQKKLFIKNWEKFIKPLTRNKLINKSTYDSKQNENLYTFQYQKFKSDLLLKNNKEFLKNFTKIKYSNDNFKNKLLSEMFNEVIPTILYQDDINAMNFSIENRSPFLDTKILKLALQIPSEKLIKYGFTKWFLRKAGSQSKTVSDDIMFDNKKIGFNLSLRTLLKNQKNIIYKLLKRDSKIYNIIDKKKFLKLFNKDNFDGDENNFIFNVISVKIFLKKYEHKYM
jgi:asparagine synthase (glutamine-hydrolysing)